MRDSKQFDGDPVREQFAGGADGVVPVVGTQEQPFFEQGLGQLQEALPVYRFYGLWVEAPISCAARS